jgi:hypothetical protein
MLCCDIVHAINTSKILHTNTSGTDDNAVGKFGAIGTNNHLIKQEGPGNSLAKDHNHSI